MKTNVRSAFHQLIPARAFPCEDFQGFAKPSRLLPSLEVNISKKLLLGEESPTISVNTLSSLYVVQLKTSAEFGSSLSGFNAAILICIIDTNGDSILQRLPITTLKNKRVPKENSESDHLRFQRGSSDTIVLKGASLGEIDALWIGLESGCWRLGGASLTVTCSQPSFTSTEIEQEEKYCAKQYQFETSEILLGDGGEVTMAELRPSNVTEVDYVDFKALLDFSQPSAAGTNISNEESMKEYADLKLSLLLYDAIVVFVGASIAAIVSNENAAYAFLIGGTSGFLYLLVLQRSVDGLSTPFPAAGDKQWDLIKNFGGFKGPLTGIALAVMFSITAVKYDLGSSFIVLTPQELLLGVAGFLTCKIAVVLAAFMPVQMNAGEDE